MKAKKEKIIIEKNLCIGCGMCTVLCPEVFELVNGKASVKEGADFEKNKKAIEEAIENCPVNAISLKKKG